MNGIYSCRQGCVLVCWCVVNLCGLLGVIILSENDVGRRKHICVAQSSTQTEISLHVLGRCVYVIVAPAMSPCVSEHGENLSPAQRAGSPLRDACHTYLRVQTRTTNGYRER